MTTKDMIKIMQAHVDGEQIQVQMHNEVWENVGKNPTWDWFNFKYRVKPKYRPLKPEELIELKGKWLDFITEEKLTAMVTMVDVPQKQVVLGNASFNPIGLITNWLHLDGTPVGKMKEQ